MQRPYSKRDFFYKPICVAKRIAKVAMGNYFELQTKHFRLHCVLSGSPRKTAFGTGFHGNTNERS